MAQQDSNAVSVASNLDVLIAEYRRIWPDKPAPESLEDYHKRVKENGQAALCLSGGGIRSASFGLGVVQALSRAGLLTRFHYLSTVSGGGYTGSLLQRWIHEQGNDAEKVMVSLSRPEEPEEIRRLRQNSNFITPKVGLRSNDTWTAVAISVRNIVLNWLLFIPLIMFVALLPNLFHDGVLSIPTAAALDRRFLVIPLGLAAVCMALATFMSVRLLPSYRRPGMKLPLDGDSMLRRWIVLPLICWAVLATLAIAIELLGERQTSEPIVHLFVEYGIDLGIFSLGGMVLGLLAAASTLRGKQFRTLLHNWLIWPLSFLLVSSWISLGAFLFGATVTEKLDPKWFPILLTTLAPLWMLSGTLLGAIFFVGFRSAGGPAVVPDDDREWIARLSAVKIKPMIFWALLAPSVLLINGLPGVKMTSGELSWPGLAAALAGIVAVLGGRSQSSGSTIRSAGTFIMRILPLHAIVAIATIIFIVALLMIFGLIEGIVAYAIATALAKQGVELPAGFDEAVVAHVAIALSLGLLFLFLGPRISVNRFSLNGLYRNRLARAFLGAARRADSRTPDPFTGFDAGDNVRMSLLAPNVAGSTVLYPVINVALNVTATENLAWQERKAEPFVFTPLHCGSGMLGGEQRPGAFADSALYAGGEHDAAMGQEGGVSLATAMSLSGAAATPNMGYYSAPATAFLMTLFNVRLGAWLPNPVRAPTLGRKGMMEASPRNSLGAILSELRGVTHDRGRHVYLSDGGHFENLALYEMIRRRCRYVLVSDASADPQCVLKDLGNAVRKVKIDFNVDIDFPKLRLAKRGAEIDDGEEQTAWALGRIVYPEGGEPGYILYLKPSFFGAGLPADVIAYARGCEAFPHETTADQFFSESQFESYRRLGDHFLTRLLLAMAVIRNAAGRDGVATLAEFFDAVAEIDKAPGKLKAESWVAAPADA